MKISEIILKELVDLKEEGKLLKKSKDYFSTPFGVGEVIAEVFLTDSMYSPYYVIGRSSKNKMATVWYCENLNIEGQEPVYCGFLTEEQLRNLNLIE
ncbi:hypothetical protein [Persephonella sp. KM09-Lau-8]|uniref:hypothetical protein n=1 Tax=Persephonella sp. KM09-Lau-8 TaxID=1158345 RepID=UPI0004981496|nr:hypothetical protein [Persephonella sp. KM09-Lau-8]